MSNYLITLMYDGSQFHGWQVQNNAVTVQQCLQDAIEQILRVRENVTGCSRTDSGVHANMFCCNMRSDAVTDINAFKKSLNAVLPDSIAVTDVKTVDDDFHARYSCIGKEYMYLIYNADYISPFYVGRALHYPYKLDEELINKNARDFLGTHDFTSFCSAGSSVEDKVRTVKSISFKKDGNLAYLSIEADGFLYNMVRIITGTLLDINSGKIKDGAVSDIIKAKDRSLAGFTAKPCGLYLNKVFY